MYLLQKDINLWLCILQAYFRKPYFKKPVIPHYLALQSWIWTARGTLRFQGFYEVKQNPVRDFWYYENIILFGFSSSRSSCSSSVKQAVGFFSQLCKQKLTWTSLSQTGKVIKTLSKPRKQLPCILIATQVLFPFLNMFSSPRSLSGKITYMKHSKKGNKEYEHWPKKSEQCHKTLSQLMSLTWLRFISTCPEFFLTKDESSSLHLITIS